MAAALPDLVPQVIVERGSLIGSGKSGMLLNGDQAKWLWLTACADHVVPASRSGATHLDNLVKACAGCNHGRMTRTLEQLDVVDPRLPTIPSDDPPDRSTTRAP